MTDDDVRHVIRQVLDEDRERHTALMAANLDDVVLKTIATILTSFGIDEDDRKEIRADFIHLRKWRLSVERVEKVGWSTVITVIVTGVLGALWLGVKAALGK